MMIDAKDFHHVVVCVQNDFGLAMAAARNDSERGAVVAGAVRDATIGALQAAEEQIKQNLDGRLFEPKGLNISTIRQDNSVTITVVSSYTASSILAGKH